MRRAIVILFAVSALTAACGGKSAFELQVGDCFDDPSDTEVIKEVPERECAAPHDNEVYANRAMPNESWPGEEAVWDWADEACLAEFEPYVGASYEASSLDFAWLVPTEASWNGIDDRTVTCFLYDLDYEKLTGSVRNAGI